MRRIIHMRPLATPDLGSREFVRLVFRAGVDPSALHLSSTSPFLSPLRLPPVVRPSPLPWCGTCRIVNCWSGRRSFRRFWSLHTYCEAGRLQHRRKHPPPCAARPRRKPQRGNFGSPRLCRTASHAFRHCALRYRNCAPRDRSPWTRCVGLSLLLSAFAGVSLVSVSISRSMYAVSLSSHPSVFLSCVSASTPYLSMAGSSGMGDVCRALPIRKLL